MTEDRKLHPLELVELSKADRAFRLWSYMADLLDKATDDKGDVVTFRRPRGA